MKGNGTVTQLFRFAMAVLVTTSVFAQAPAPKNGFITDEKTAIRVAEAILAPIYGDQQIAQERPFQAALHGGIWTVEGTLSKGDTGGVAQIRIDQRTGAVVSYIHGK